MRSYPIGGAVPGEGPRAAQAADAVYLLAFFRLPRFRAGP